MKLPDNVPCMRIRVYYACMQMCVSAGVWAGSGDLLNTLFFFFKLDTCNFIYNVFHDISSYMLYMYSY